MPNNVARFYRWVKQIKLMFETQVTEFVLVGALHWAGVDSVLKQLLADGYTVEQLEDDQLN